MKKLSMALIAVMIWWCRNGAAPLRHEPLATRDAEPRRGGNETSRRKGVHLLAYTLPVTNTAKHSTYIVTV